MEKRRALGVTATLMLGTALVAAPADARSRYVAPYIELGQVVTADLTNDDVLTYSTIAAGIDAGVQSSRAEAQVSYRYERRIAWDDDVGDQDIHTGLARGSVQLGQGLSVEGGALATRTRANIDGAAPGNLAGNVDNISQVYSFYAGPTATGSIGPVQVNGAYRFGYTKVEVPNAVQLAPGQSRRDYFDDSTSHVVTASAGVAAGDVLPVGITLSGAYEREDAGQLDQQYEGAYGRGDVTLPVSRTVAIRGGVGWEKITASQRDALVDGAGNPVLDGNGRYITDPNSPQRIAYNTDGLIYDAGVIWRPSPRLELQANAGWRYGGETYFGSLNYAASHNTALQVAVYDGIQTFGRQLRDGLRDLPTSFNDQPDPFGQQFNGCVFGAAGTGGNVNSGGCLNDIFQSVATASYRARGIDAAVTKDLGRTVLGFGAGYANRRLYVPDGAPGAVYYGAEDESAYGQLFWSRALSRVSAVDANLYVNWYNSQLPGSAETWGAGANGSYTHQFGRLGTIASLGVYTFDQEALDAQWSAQALLGARYTF